MSKPSAQDRRQLPPRPYKRWDYFEFQDSPIFFGRETEKHVLVSEILSSRLVLLYAKSGTGKTSLINAGARPVLEDSGFRTAVVRMGADPLAAIKSDTRSLRPPGFESPSKARLAEYFQSLLASPNKPVVLFLDQFEEFFIHLKEDVQQDFIEQIAEVYHDQRIPVFLVFSLREDFFVEMDMFRNSIPNIFHNNSNLRLHWLAPLNADQAVNQPASLYGFTYDPEVVRTILSYLGGEHKRIEPIRLQIVCDTLYDQMGNRANRTITAEDYEELGGAEAIERAAFHRAIKGAVAGDRRGLLPRLLEALITGVGTKNHREQISLLETLKIERPALEELLTPLENARLIRTTRRDDQVFYELAHDYLAKQVMEWLGERRDSARKSTQLGARLAATWRHDRKPIGENKFSELHGDRHFLQLDSDAVDMMAQAAIVYGKHRSFWLGRLSTEKQALSLIEELLAAKREDDDALALHCIEALDYLRSADATRRMAEIAVSGRPVVRQKAVEALLGRDQEVALNELYRVMDESTEGSARQMQAIQALATFRENGVPLTRHRAKVYPYLKWTWPKGEKLEFWSAPLGRALGRYEDSLRSEVKRASAKLEALLAVPAIAGGAGGFVTSLGLAILGVTGAFLYTLLRNAKDIIVTTFSSGLPGWAGSWELLSRDVTAHFWTGLKYGGAIGFVLGFAVFAIEAYGRAAAAIRIIDRASDTVRKSALDMLPWRRTGSASSEIDD